MTEYNPIVPHDCHVCGFIYDDTDKTLLSQDMLDVILPNDILVTVGWYEDELPNGSYRIEVHGELEELDEPLYTTDAQEACRLTEMQTRKWLKHRV